MAGTAAALGMAAVCLLACAAGCGGREYPDLEPRNVRLAVPGEADLSETFYPALEPVRGGAVLVTDKGAPTEAWAPLATRLAAERVASVTVGLPYEVLPGGRSTEEQDREVAQGALDAATGALAERGVPGDAVALVGAGAGANVALWYAARTPSIASVVGLSPFDELGGESILDLTEAYGRRPLLLLVETGDPYGAAVARQVKQVARGYAEFREYEGAARGADIMTTSPSALEQVVLWLGTTL